MDNQLWPYRRRTDFLVLGSRWLVHGAVAIAKAIGIGELIIGLTVVAAGTSLPEVATSVIASIRGERNIAVGNVVGSNIFNILVVLGLSSLVASDGIKVSTAAIRFDIPIMIAVSIACLPIFFTDNMIARWEGVLFLGYYIVYALPHVGLHPPPNSPTFQHYYGTICHSAYPFDLNSRDLACYSIKV